jgi:RNA polymerase sigma-70 factor, ECF subfamily
MFASMLPLSPDSGLDAFQATVARHSRRWFAACVSITRDAGLAEDAVQEALISAWRNRHQYQGESELQHWIHRIAVNSALQILRRQRGQPLLDEHPEDAVDPASPDQARSAQEFGHGLAMALAVLSDFERTCFVLKHLEQWRLDEIAESLQTGVNSIKQALFRAVRKLRASMAAWRSES